MYVNPQPFDIIVIKGLDWNIPDALVEWRSLSEYSHCLFVYDDKENVYDPSLDGLTKQTIDEYSNRDVVVCRIRDQAHLAQVQDAMFQWLDRKFDTNKGYDYLAWVGFATGIKELEDEDKWYCSELPYWCFQEHGFQISNKDLTFMYPSFFVDNPSFEIIYEGKL